MTVFLNHQPTSLKCAPGRGQTITGTSVGTCFNTTELKQIANTWNSALSSRPPTSRTSDTHSIGGRPGQPPQPPQPPSCLQRPIDLSTHTTASDLWKEIQKRMVASTTCQRNGERCWLSQLPSVYPALGPSSTQQLASIDRAAFRPAMPRSWAQKPNDWLSTTDIERVMKQYEAHDPHFRFIGAVPIDFASPRDDGAIGKCVTQALCEVDIREWLQRRGYHRVGIVFNLDAHNEPGSHWVSAFLDLIGNAMMYYDSFGGRVPLQVQRLFSSVGAQLEQHHGQEPAFRYNPARHQFRNTECGVYSILFLASMVEAAKRRRALVNSYDEFVALALNDHQVERYRRHFFDDLRNMIPGGAWVLVRRGGRRQILRTSPSRRHMEGGGRGTARGRGTRRHRTTKRQMRQGVCRNKRPLGTRKKNTPSAF
jgi:hypothetical protein